MKTNYEIRYAAHPEDAKGYDTQRIRRDFLMEKVFSDNEVNMVYSMYDRMIVGGARPVGEVLKLEAIDPLKAPYFLTRREMGIFNVGGPGVVKAGDAVFELDYKEALYLGSGDREVTFESKDVKNPAKFYFNSVTAHRNYPDKKVTKADAIVAEMGSLEGSNHRCINKMLVSQVLPTCQLQMGMTELKPGSVWNTMPAHVHSRRMEAYFYFEVPDEHAVCHFMGEVDETRHIWMKGDQAVLSPEWSIHSAAATQLYISQPTVSLQIKKLEQHFSIKLFYRNGKQSVIPTKEADFLYPKMLSIIESLTTSFAQAAEKENFKEDCIIASSNTVAIYLLPDIMESLVTAFPLINFSIQLMNSNEVVDMVQNNHAHIGLIEKPIETKNLHKEIVYEDQLVLAGDAASKFWLLREKNSGLRFFNELYLNEHSINLPIIELNNNEVLLQLLKNNIGQSIVSRLSISDEIPWQPIDQSFASRKIFIVQTDHHANTSFSEVYNRIVEKIRERQT